MSMKNELTMLFTPYHDSTNWVPEIFDVKKSRQS